jgi:transposase InsO family protein
MNKLARYPQEVRERSVRRVFEHTEEHGSQRAAIRSIAGNLRMSPETLRPADLVDRDFRASRPNPLRVADITYVAIWNGFVCDTEVIRRRRISTMSSSPPWSRSTGSTTGAGSNRLATSRRPNTKCSTGRSPEGRIQSDSQNRVSTKTGAIH